MPKPDDDARTKPKGIKRLLGALGPGLAAGAADDDPSGVATFSVVGAKFGTQFLWTAVNGMLAPFLLVGLLLITGDR